MSEQARASEDICRIAKSMFERGLAGKRAAVVLANHGPVVAGKDVWAAAYAIEELQETAKLAILSRGIQPNMLSKDQVGTIVEKFDVQWDN